MKCKKREKNVKDIFLIYDKNKLKTRFYLFTLNHVIVIQKDKNYLAF